MSTDLLLYVLALVSFVLATFGWIKDINGVALGLALLTLSLLV